jgi:hypothetical protein
LGKSIFLRLRFELGLLLGRFDTGLGWSALFRGFGPRRISSSCGRHRLLRKVSLALEFCIGLPDSLFELVLGCLGIPKVILYSIVENC